MSDVASFGSWLRRRRRALDLTQEDLAGQVGCAAVTIRKIETDERRPSQQLAERLASYLRVVPEQRAEFLRLARMVPTPHELAQLPIDGSDGPAGLAAALARRGYTLGERLGSGGFGEVYRAGQPSVGRTVAIKIILPQHTAHPQFIERFEAEARLIAQLEHPSIVPLYDYWRDRSRAYLAMRLMRGGSLRAALASGPLAPAESARLSEQLAAALAAAHRHQIIHRDLKPANVLLDAERNAYLADFGIAKDLAAPHPDAQTLPGVIVGSPAYLAPEQIIGRPPTLQTDVYSLGLLLFELLTGYHPFAGAAPADMLDCQLHRLVPALGRWRPDLPAALDTLIQRATAKLAHERYPDALSLLAELQPALAHARAVGTPLPLPPSGYFTFLDKGHADGYRHEAIEPLAQAIRARENRLVLGLPGMGVSNMLRFLVARGPAFVPHALFAYHDCDTQARDYDTDELYRALADQLAEQGLGAASAEATPGYERLRRLLQQFSGGPAERAVLVIDQADRLVAAADRSFYHQLKALTDLNKRVCVVLAASPRAAAQADPDDLLFAGRRLALGRLGARDVQGAIDEEQRRLGVAFDAPTQALLTRLIGGHPGLLRALASAAVAGALAGVAAEASAAARMLARDDVRYRCRKLWDALPAERQAALGRFAAGEPLDEVQRDWLREVGLIERADGVDQICSPLVRLFALAQAAPAEHEPPRPGGLAAVMIEQPTLNERGVVVAGFVRQGGRDTPVSPLMLRLIACLMRERKIYTRHEIAAYVWFDVSAEGVSGAAIDDLIRQVRQRLGKQYIKVHRGQGYEWAGPWGG